MKAMLWRERNAERAKVTGAFACLSEWKGVELEWEESHRRSLDGRDAEEEESEGPDFSHILSHEDLQTQEFLV